MNRCCNLLLLGFLFLSSGSFALDLSMSVQIPIGGRIAGRPLQNNSKTVVVLSEDRSIYLFDQHGSLNHRIHTHYRFSGVYALAADGTIYAASGPSTIMAFNQAGEIRWTRRFDSALGSNLLIGPGGELYVLLQNGWLHVLSPSGFTRWKYHTDISSNLPVSMDSQGRIVIAADTGFMHVFLPWGEPVWEFRLAGSPVIYAFWNDALLCSTSEFTLAKVGKDGTLLWQQVFDSKIIDIVHDTRFIYALSESGRIYVLTANGEQVNERMLNASLDKLYLSEQGLIATGTAMRHFYYLLHDSSEYLRVSLQAGISSATLLRNGLLLIAADDWFVYGFQASTPVSEGWSQSGGVPFYNWSMLSDSRQNIWLSYFKTDSEYQSIQAFLDFGFQNNDNSAINRALDIIENSMQKPGIYMREPYLVHFLATVILDHIENRSARPPQRNFHSERVRALILLSRIESNYASLVYRDLLRYEKDETMLHLIYENIQRFPMDPDGINARFLAASISGLRDQSSINAASYALLALVNYRGSISDASIRDAALTMYRNSRDPGVKRRAARIMRYRQD